VASDGFSSVLALEVALSGWAAESSGGDPPADPGDEPGQSLWGAPRIHGELLKLGIEVAQSTVAKYMARSGRGRSQTWKTFVDSHAAGIGAMDFLIVPTVGFRLLFVLVILRHERRRLISMSITDHPTAEWIARQLTDAFPWDEAPDYMIRDRDGCYGRAGTKRLAAMGIRDRDDRQLPIAAAIDDSAVARADIAVDVGAVPSLGVADIGDGDVVVLASEERHGIEALPAPENVAAAVCPWRSATTQCSTRIFSPVCWFGHWAMSPAAKMPVTLVSRYSFTSMPRSEASPACSASEVTGRTPIPTTTTSGGG
jgi:hypothetical protein